MGISEMSQHASPLSKFFRAQPALDVIPPVWVLFTCFFMIFDPSDLTVRFGPAILGGVHLTLLMGNHVVIQSAL